MMTRVGDPALDDALQVLQRILVGAAEEHDEVERLAAQGAPDALEHREEPGVGAGREALVGITAATMPVRPLRRLRPDWFGT